MFPVIVSQSNIYSHAPIEIRIESADCDSGDYQIPIILTYGTDEEISQAREDAVVHVNSKTEQYRWFIRVVGLIIALLTLIISAGIAEVLIVPALENLIS